MKNSLKDTLSPYLLQHADNPVDWQVWDEDAFKLAADLDKPVFLSIGYSTCHWCHVMAHESFEDPDMAALLNDTFVCIKVDREERPDIDHVYMTVCQMLTGSGGWPLTIMMSPDKKPFYAATYIPKNSRFGRPGLADLILKVKQMWRDDRQSLLLTTEKVMAAMDQSLKIKSGTTLQPSVLDTAYEFLETAFDERNGGFGGAPKFPSPHHLLFLLRYWRSTGCAKALHMVTHTLKKMRQGGIYDHLGYGFHRYATDEKWRVPHFEKMLYDQALISMAYVEAYQVTKENIFNTTAKEIYQYVLSELTSSDGGFYTAEDADSEGMEGRFYLWSIDEIFKHFSKKETDLLIDWFNLEPEGNFMDEASNMKNRFNILHRLDTAEELNGKGHDRLKGPGADLDALLKKLHTIRSLRKRPFRDQKILTDWNGLMIASLARGAKVLNSPELLSAAVKAAHLILSRMKHPDGGLFHVCLDNRPSTRATLNDYVFLIWGLLELCEAGFDLYFLESAVTLNRYLLDNFWDEADGGFFSVAHQAEKVLMRYKEVYDGAMPSGNSVALMNMIRLSKLTGDFNLENSIEKLLNGFTDEITRSPTAHTMFLAGVSFVFGPSCEIVISGKKDGPDVRELLDIINAFYLPNCVLLFNDINDSSNRLHQLCPFLRNMTCINNKATVYVCRNNSCERPLTEKAGLKTVLKSLINNVTGSANDEG